MDGRLKLAGFWGVDGAWKSSDSRPLRHLSYLVYRFLFAEGLDAQACTWCIPGMLVAPSVSCIFVVSLFFSFVLACMTCDLPVAL